MSDVAPAPSRTIAIVGAGYSGTLCAVNLLRQHRGGGGGIRIVLVERHARPGRGIAYRTWDDNFVLNVPAGNMSALADEPHHFVQYCRNIDPAFNAGSFVSRRIYGDYLEATLQQAAQASGANLLRRVQGEVIAVRHNASGVDFQLDLADGNSLHANQVVLAFGHFAPLDPYPHLHSAADFYRSAAYVGNPWDFAALDRINGDAPVALLGAAHTAVDVLFRLTSQNDARKIYLISRRGLALQSHRSHPQSPVVSGFPSFFADLDPTVRQYCRALRSQAAQVLAQGGDWRDVINSVRPYTGEIWQRFPLTEQRRFLSRMVAYWDIHRHRLAPVAHLRLGQMLASGQVEAVAGTVQGYAIGNPQDGKAVSVTVRERHSGRSRTLAVAHVVNCTGPNYDIATIDAPLIVQLRNEGYLQQDSLKLGFAINDGYQAVNRDGVAVNNLFYVGPMLKARYWEAIAVPELRLHTRRLAEILAG